MEAFLTRDGGMIGDLHSLKLFLRSVGVDNSENYFAVAPGEYDVVVLSFLPSGSMKPQTIKLDDGDVPTDVFVHEFS